jgi:hypothetical protein
MILLQFPARRQPMSTRQRDLLTMQNEVFGTLNDSLRRLDPQLHRFFMVKSLTVILGQPGLDELPIITLAELLFALLDSCDDCHQLLDLQNVFIYVSQLAWIGGATCAQS